MDLGNVYWVWATFLRVRAKMADFWPHVRQLAWGVAVLAMLVALGVYWVGKIRSKTAQKEPSASELLTKFREMHSRGVLSDEEFRTIKTTLTERLQTEIEDKDNTGQ